MRLVADIGVRLLSADFLEKLFIILQSWAAVFDRGIGVDLAGNEDDLLAGGFCWKRYVADAEVVFGDFIGA